MTWVLKMLAGKHTGAEMEINKTHLIIGADSERADCVITDSGLADEAIQITVTDSLLAVKELNKVEWYLNGRLQRGRISRLKPYDVIQVGTIAFTIGDKETTWPPVEVPVQKRFRVPRVGLFISGLLCVGSLNASLYFAKHSQFDSTQKLIEPEDAGSNYGLIITEKGEHAIITGYVPDLPISAMARKNIEQTTQLPLIWKAHRQDKLVVSVSTWLYEHGFKGYDVNVDSSGIATVKGVMPNSSATSNLAVSIKNDIPGLKLVIFDVFWLSDVLNWLNQAILQTDMVNVGASEYHDQILISGIANDAQKQQLFQLIKAANQQFGSQIAIDYRSYIELDGILPSLKAVSTSLTPYVELVGGKKYLIDSVIGDGFTIRAITDEGISLSKGGQSIWIASGG